ncbi:probable receptor-like protein kinase At5g20050 [Impatiens glandulifera]|uniref:probable receptor-like protein kinase At5g20050 n=1 Tax=Impatiens glandulifera TaxID=253017 RepID=UPI001FB11A88|nr:probable receptor-like protein kinase At5g20050 [Impatiens glandulifera]
MEGKKVNIIAFISVIILTIVIIISRIYLQLSKPFYLITGAGGAAIFSIISIVIFRHRFNNRRRLLETQLISEGRELRIEYSFLRKVAGVPTKFRYRELEEATDGFQIQSIIGQGASGSVFQGILLDGTSVAVKRIEGEKRGEAEFKSEVSAIASVQHKNLVRLLGYCIVPTGPRFLVYDFIPNGSLDNWIFIKNHTNNNFHSRRSGCLSWDLRRRVAADVARALCYLHHDCRKKILHLDVKPENILLDDGYRGLVADFGLSKLMGRDESRVVTTVRGTRGYLAPEWLLEHGASEKSDIYSYGMVLLEIIGGRRNVCVIDDNGPDKSTRKFQYFPKLVYEKMKQGKLMEIVDERLEMGEIDEREVRRLIHVAFWCIQENASLRPSMAEVVEMLDGRVPVEEPPETQMIVVDLLCIDDDLEERGCRPRIGAVTACPTTESQMSSTISFGLSVISGR